MYHRNSQKRIYTPGRIYFITTLTHLRYPYFKNPLFCELFMDELLVCKDLKGFDLHGHAIMPDHVHLLIEPKYKNTYSEIMRSLKTNFSRNANRITRDEDFSALMSGQRSHPAVQKRYQKLQEYRQRFIDQYGHTTRRFKWQKSFYDHIIRNSDDLFNHCGYILNQWTKHNSEKNKNRCSFYEV
ncbi:MAG: hypothetical protein GY754_44675 [bacterium]|nr:hypothetical protein [bacterium]